MDDRSEGCEIPTAPPRCCCWTLEQGPKLWVIYKWDKHKLLWINVSAVICIAHGRISCVFYFSSLVSVDSVYFRIIPDSSAFLVLLHVSRPEWINRQTNPDWCTSLLTFCLCGQHNYNGADCKKKKIILIVLNFNTKEKLSMHIRPRKDNVPPHILAQNLCCKMSNILMKQVHT